MESAKFWLLDHVSDQELQQGLSELLARGARTEARVIAHIAAIEDRRLDLRSGCPSLFEYCIRRLGFSQAEAYLRITAARLARRFPVIFGLIERREIHLSGVCLLRDYLSVENHAQLLSDACGKTKLELLELLAYRFPRPDVVSRVRKLPARGSNSRAEVESGSATTAPSWSNAARTTGPSHEAQQQPVSARSNSDDMSPSVLKLLEATSPRALAAELPAATTPLLLAKPLAVIEPTSAARYRLQLNMSAQLRDKLEQARALLSHAVPDGNLAIVVERALDELLRELKKRRFAQVDSPRRPTAKRKATLSLRNKGARREHVSHATRREVIARDGLRCSYTSPAGCRCTATAFLQLHHQQPWARGGDSSAENLQVLCQAHNRLRAEQDFGREKIAHFVETK